MALPWSTVVDLSYVGQHGYNIVEGINLNGVDFGTAFLAENQDRTLAATTPGATSLSTDQMRAFRGFSGITQNVSRGWITHHSLQLSFNRRFRDGLSFGFNDTMAWEQGSVGARLSTILMARFLPRRPAEADKLRSDAADPPHDESDFVWDCRSESLGAALRALAGDQRWQLAVS